MTTQTNIIRVNVSSYTDTRLHDPALSDAAYRLLHHLLSRPPEEPTIYPKQLMKNFGWGRDKTYKTLNELQEKGYVTLRRYRRGAEWIINDIVRPLELTDEVGGV